MPSVGRDEPGWYQVCPGVKPSSKTKRYTDFRPQECGVGNGVLSPILPEPSLLLQAIISNHRDREIADIYFCHISLSEKI